MTGFDRSSSRPDSGGDGHENDEVDELARRLAQAKENEPSRLDKDRDDEDGPLVASRPDYASPVDKPSWGTRDGAEGPQTENRNSDQLEVGGGNVPTRSNPDASAAPNENERLLRDPTDESDGDSDKKLRLERLRSKFFEHGEDILDVTEKGANNLQELLSRRPPTGHAETRAVPAVVESPRPGVDAGNAATGLLVAALVAGEIARWARAKLDGAKGDGNGGDR